MRLPTGVLQRSKTGLHVLQGLLIFIVWAITIAILVADGPTDSRPRWYFAVCWLSLPVLIYQTMVPIWERAQQFANAYAYAALDVVFAIFWFSAFIAVAVWNAAGINDGAAKANVSPGNCTTFDFGPEEKCNLSKATAGMGGIIFILFCVTSAMSVYGLIYFRKHGSLPGANAGGDSSYITAQTKEAFSTAEHGDTAAGMDHGDDEYALLHSTESGEGRHPGRPVSWAGGAEPEAGTDQPYDGHYDGRYDPHENELDGSYAQVPSYDNHPPQDYPGPGGDHHDTELSPRPDHGTADPFADAPPSIAPLQFPQADYSYRGHLGA